MTGIRRLSFALISCLLLVGCATNSHRAKATSDSESMRSTAAAGSFAASPGQPTRANSRLNNEPPQAVDAFQPKIIYTASLGLSVDRVSIAQDKAVAIVEKFNGYLGESTPGKLVIRVPSDAFKTVLKELESLGGVTQRQVQAQDATERVVDLESRLKSGYALRDRLIQMIDRAENIEHALRVQQELSRVVDQIELMQGRLRLAKNQVAYATITLTIRQTPAEQRLRAGIPIAWVRDLGTDFRKNTTINVTEPRRLRSGVSVDLPEGFIRYFQDDYVTQAVDANGVRVQVRRFKNFDQGALVFWQRLISRSLSDNAGLTLEKAQEIDLERGGPGRIIHGNKRIAGETVQYLLAVGVSDDHVYVFEAWGVEAYYAEVQAELEQAITTMRCY